MTDTTPSRVLLVRPRYHCVAERMALLPTEPLELEYLARAVRDFGGLYKIWDGGFDQDLGAACKDFKPTHVALTGYYAARNQMLDYAKIIKGYCPHVIVIAGGVHAELNPADFCQENIDLIVSSGGYFTFLNILSSGDRPYDSLKGIWYRRTNGDWHENARAPFPVDELPDPDRSYFLAHKDRFHYLHLGTVALVKTGFGCPFDCSFCYCRLLNDGNYTARPVHRVVQEIAAIDCELIWLVDDTFLLDEERIKEFAFTIHQQGIKKNFIIYGRASFICDHKDLLPKLKEMGVIEVIVGLEAIEEEMLHSYNKHVTAWQNSRCIKLLHEHDINCTGLFIMTQQATAADFRNLDRWIGRHKLSSYTISVYTPFPGTKEFERYAKQLLSDDPVKWNLFSLVLAPEQLSRFGFMIRLYWLQAKILFRNQRLAAYLVKRLLVWS
ncbi:B12-binding domain-containing radical SAM protein [Desulfopila sp. IMCC35008]|uniref:B12-binding domain-containing radical SAM protein n=1 Tax=Desulfopila sp. IMCC35008 TaxID=2653858 RepID=UPI0013D0D703|nr:B12-binding domain-containing radical SAM protein [Desulfopila sp. IMCC35008]